VSVAPIDKRMRQEGSVARLSFVTIDDAIMAVFRTFRPLTDPASSTIVDSSRLKTTEKITTYYRTT
jgi:hypothetical protein